MKNKIVNLLMIVIIGGISGIFGVQIFLPWIAGFSFFNKIDWIRQSREGVTIINRMEKIEITESEALEQAIEKAQKIVVGVISQRTEKIVAGKKTALAKPEILAQGTGFIVSSDGLVVTSLEVVPTTAQKVLVIFENKESQAEIKKTDKNSGLVLLKINENNLPVLPFLEDNLKLGQTVFLVGTKFQNIVSSASSIDKFVDLSIIRQSTPNMAVDFLSKEISGSPIFNIRAEIVGVNLSGKKIVLEVALKELLK